MVASSRTHGWFMARGWLRHAGGGRREYHGSPEEIGGGAMNLAETMEVPGGMGGGWSPGRKLCSLVLQVEAAMVGFRHGVMELRLGGSARRRGLGKARPREGAEVYRHGGLCGGWLTWVIAWAEMERKRR